MNCLHDLMVDFLRAPRCVDDPEPVRVPPGKVEECLADIPVELHLFRIETVGFERGAAAAPFDPQFGIEVEHQRQVGFQLAAGKAVDPQDHVEIQAAGVSLIGRRRIEEPVAEQDPAPFQHRQDQMPRHLGMARAEQQQFRFRGKVVPFRAYLQQVPDLLRDRGPAGGTRHLHMVSGRGQRIGKQADLGAFPASFHALEGDETPFFTTFLHLFLALHLRFRRFDCKLSSIKI